MLFRSCTQLIGVEAVDGSEQPFLFVPDFPDLPMEEVYPREEPRGAAVIARQHAGGGRTVYIPWNIGAIFWEVFAGDHARLIANSVHWALGKRPDVELEGQAVVDLSVREGEGSTVVLVNNITNPMMMKGPIREVYPVGPLTLSLAVPAGRELRAVERLSTGEDLDFALADGRVRVSIAQLETLDAIQLHWN